MTQLPWTPLALTARLAELGAEASFIAGSSAEDHVVATLRERTHGKDVGLQLSALVTRLGRATTLQRRVNGRMTLAGACVMLGVVPTAAMSLPTVTWMGTPGLLSLGHHAVRVGFVLERMTFPDAPDAPLPVPDRRQECHARVDRVKLDYGRLRGDLVYRIENSALFDPDAPLTRQFETALVLWDDVDASTPAAEVLRRAGMVEVTFATARSAAETLGLAHLPLAARPDADRAAKAARLARASDADAERRTATERVASILRRLDLAHLPDPSALDRELTRGPNPVSG